VDLSLETRTHDGHTVVEVGGEIDVYTAPKLRECLVDLVNAGNYRLVIDLEGVEFLDSTGLGVLVGGLKRVRSHEGTLHLVCTHERLLKIFRITGLTKVFPIHDSVEAAVSDSATTS
jgi:anti-sigma B factor antagonist